MLLRPLPLWERATQRFNEEEWVRGFRLSHEPLTHPSFADASELPSPAGGEGTITSTSLAARSTTRLAMMYESDSRFAGGIHIGGGAVRSTEMRGACRLPSSARVAAGMKIAAPIFRSLLSPGT